MKTDLERIKKDIETLAEFSEEGKGVTRFSYSKEDKEARKYILSEAKKIGLEIKVDGIGIIRARYKGQNPNLPPVLIGSHIDSVKNGGRYDGVIGVIGALEVLRVLYEDDVRPKRSVELIIFPEEEGSNFGTTMVGSKALIGKYGIKDFKALKTKSGKSMDELVSDFGLDPDSMAKSVIKKGDIEAMLELHIEQSVVLEKNKLPIGIVEAIAGMKSYHVTYRGQANHAGSTPMNMRKNALLAAAKVILGAEKIVNEKGFPTTVGTVGQINCIPNVPNVIAGEVIFSFDVRDVDPMGIDIVAKAFEHLVKKIAGEDNLEYAIQLVGESKPVYLDKDVIKILEDVIKKQGHPYMKMYSGAVHDSCMMTDYTSVGMIFVPSKDGVSHAPEEYTDYDSIKRGCDVLLGAVLSLTA